MTLQEYVISLQDQNLSQEEIYAKVEEWKKKNPQPQVEEEVEEVVEEKPMKLTFESATEPIEQEEKLEEDKPISLTIDSATEPIEPEVDVNEFDFKSSQNNINKLETDLIQISGGDMEMDAMDAPNRIKMYNDTLIELNKAIEDHNTALRSVQDEEQIEKDKIAKKSYLKKLVTVDLAKGSTTLGEMMFGLGESFYDIFSLPQNLLVKAGVLPEEFEASSKKFKEEFGITNALLDFYQKESEELGKEQAIWNNENYDTQGIYENFKKGNWSDGFKQLGSGLAESAPVSIGMMAGGASTSIPRLAAGSTPMFVGPELERLREENPGASEFDLTVKAIGLAGAETVFSAIGTGTLGKVYKDILLKEGKQQGLKIFRNGLIEMYEQALKKAGAPVGALGEGIEEVATQITQNMINGKDPFEGVNDAFLQGLGGGATYSGPINVMQVKQGIQEAVAINKINKNIVEINPNFNVNNLTEVYSKPVELSTPISSLEELKIAQVPNANIIVDQQIKKDLELGKINQEQADNIQNNFNNITKATQQLKPLGLQENVEASNLLIEKNKLQQKIKEVGDPALTKEDTARVNEINDRLGEIVTEEKAAFEKEKAETVGMSILPTRKSLPKADELATQYQQDPSAVDVEALLDQYNRIGLAAIKFDTRKGDMAREDAVAEINKEFAGIMDRWSPDKGSFSTFVTANIAPKAQGIYDKYIGQKDATTLDRPEAREVVAEEVDIDVTPQETGRAKVYPATLEVITENVTPEVRSEQTTMIKDDINRAVATVSTSPKAVAKNIVDQIKTKEYRQLLKNKLGKWNSEQYNNNVDRLITKDFIATLPVAQLKRRFPRLFEIEVVDRVPTVKIEDGKRTDFKKPVYKIPAITDAKLETIKEYFKDNEKRHQSLMEVLGEGVAVEQMQELRGDQAFMTGLQGRLELKGSNLTAEQFLDEVEYNLDKRNLEDKSLDVLETEVVKEVKPVVKREKSKIQKAKEKINLKNIESYIDFRAKGDFSLDKILKFEKANKSNPEYKELRKKAITDFLDSVDPSKREKYRLLLRESMVSSKRTNYKDTTEFDNDFPGVKPKRGEGSRTLYKKLNQRIVDKIKSKDFQKEQTKKVDTLIDLFNDIGRFAAKNIETIPVWDSMINDAGNNMKHVVKTHAPIRFYPIDINTNKPDFDSLIDEEHSMPAQNVARLLFFAGLTNQMDIIAPVIKGSYMQGGLLASEHAVLNSKEVGLKDKMNQAFDLVFKGLREGSITQVAQGLGSLIRYTEGNFINPNQYVLANTGKTIAETYDVEVKKDLRKVPNVIEVQNRAITRLIQGVNKSEVLKAFKTELNIAIKASEANLTIQEYTTDILEKRCTSPCRVPRTSKQVKDILSNSGKAKANAQIVNKETKGLSAFDMDDTLALTKEKVKYTMPDGTTGELTAGEFAVEAENLTEEGAEFDFSNFENVDLSTPKGPLAGEALKKQAKYGSKDIYVVTARPGAAQQSIKTFLDSIGLNIPLKNIITLEDGSPQAKADWVISKAEEGYNDFYFADDSALNVDTVQKILDQIDVKSKTQIAIANKAKRLDTEFNKQIEDVTGKEDFKKYSDARARLEGKQKDKGVFKRFINQFTITPSADDFMGLMYAFMGKGKQGNKHAQFIKENLMDPYNKAEQELLSAKVTVANDFASLKDAFPTLKSKNGKNPLMQEIGVGPYTKSQAIRVYMWNKQGMEIPGMSKRDIDALVAAVENDLELLPFADNVMLVQKNKEYPAPTKNWLAGDITTDILRGLDTTYRKELMTEFNENSDIIFSPENLNKIEALYGSKFRESLVDSLRRMKSGSNRPVFVGSGARIVNEMMDWLNSSVGAVMFLNMRSGLLQLISNVNFINWGDNNVYNAAKAFTSKDYFPTVLKLMNSDYLVNRRDGLKINVNEAELADAGRQGGIKGMINYILDKGFAITRVMDSIAIATGGATFFINRKKSLQNRVNPETGKLYTEVEAESKAFDDFYAIAEETQQSSNPARISQQQASFAGRVILSFQNVTMQYNRKTKKSIQDLYNRRKKPGMTQRESDLSNLSSIIYYVGVQNLVFNALQQALFALAFEDEPEEKEKANAASIANGMLDSLLFGLGFGGAIVSTVKNVVARVAEESEKKTTQYRDTVWNVFDISPVLDSKVRKLRTAAKTFDWNMDEIKRRGWSLDNPAYLAISQIISASTNLPLDRVLRKAMNIGQAFDEETKTWQTVALLLGWSGWNVGLPYWGRESTIKKEEAEDEKLKDKFKNDVRKFKNMGFTKRIPLTGPNSGKPSGKLGVDYIQIERPDGRIQYYKKP